VAYRMPPLPIPLNDLGGHFCCFETFITPIARETQHEFSRSALRGPYAVAELVQSEIGLGLRTADMSGTSHRSVLPHQISP